MARHILVLAILALSAGLPLAQADITEIQNNGINGQSDASYAGGVFNWHSVDDDYAQNLLTLWQGEALDEKLAMPNGSSTGLVSLDITLQQYEDFNSTLPEKAYFIGGIVDLQFAYSPDGVEVTYHRLRGKVTEGSVQVTSASSTESWITGIINFDTNDPTEGIEALPQAWPATGLSTGVALTLAIGADLSAFMNPETGPSAWANANFPALAVYETQINFVPVQMPIPEPAALSLLAVGSLALLRRRR